MSNHREVAMSIFYKTFQHLSYDALEAAREKGIEVDKQRQKELRNKKYKEARGMVNYKSLDKYWDDLLEECKIKGRG